METRQKDLALLRTLRQVGVLEDIKEASLPLEGAICLSCADGHQIGDIVRHMYDGRFSLWMRLRRWVTKQPICAHTLALNGGALLASSTSPLNRGEREILRRHAAGAIQLKGLKTIAPLAHYPCGAASAANMPLSEVMWHLREATRELRGDFPDLRVVALFHVDWGENRKRTYQLRDDHSFLASASTPPQPPGPIHAEERRPEDGM